jgi:phage repressor protein C with HTH and peptisase S24 domain
MITKQDIEKFYVDVDRLNLKFPVAVLAKQTGFSKGQISQVLNKKIEPSESLINEFYNKFNDSLKNVPHEKDEPSELELNEPNPLISYVDKRREMKNNTAGPFMVPLVPLKAQAGYTKSFNNTDFIHHLDTYPIWPGIDPHGAIWRYFEVEGDSMLDTFKQGQFLLTSQVTKEDWSNVENFYVYVIVTEEKVMVKRLAKVKGKDYWAAISDNEEKYKQFKLYVKDVRELWKYRRHMDWDASPKKKFEVKV